MYYVYQEPTSDFVNYLKENKVRFTRKRGGLGNIENYLIATRQELIKKLRKAKTFKGISSLSLSKFRTKKQVNDYIKQRS